MNFQSLTEKIASSCYLISPDFQFNESFAEMIYDFSIDKWTSVSAEVDGPERRKSQ